MKTSEAKAIWIGTLKDGEGKISLKSIDCEANYTFASRFENSKGTNPEELIGAAHAGCFSMALSGLITEKGYHPEMIETTAIVTLSKNEKGAFISKINLNSEATIPDIDNETLQSLACEAKLNCPVSKALKATDILLKIILKKS
jgi:osmotically inducible protein OsmC